MGSLKQTPGRQGRMDMRSEERFRRAVHFDSSCSGAQKPAAIDHISKPIYSQVITDGPSLVFPTDPYLTDYSRPSPVVEAALRDNHLTLTATSPNLCRTERDLQAAENTHHNFVYRAVAPTPTFVPDDLTYKMRPDTAHVVGRDYARYEPSWTWSDFQRCSPVPELVHRPAYSRSVPLSSFMAEPRPYKPRSALWTPDTRENPSTLPKMNYRTWRDQERDMLPVSSRLNTAFPFRKYRPDFTPYAPHQNMYDAVKYAPNPDWLSLRPWAHKFRKARYVYVPNEENSSKSLEMERIMREARMRELCKGLYSSSYEDSINSKVAGKLLAEPSAALPDISLRSFDAETAPSTREFERKKPLSSAEKRRRNETLAIGISRADLLKPETSNVQSETPVADETKQDVPKSSDEEALAKERADKAAKENAEKAEKEEAERVAQEVMTRLTEEKARAAVEAEERAKAVAAQEKANAEAAVKAKEEAAVKAAAEEAERLKAEEIAKAEAEAAEKAAAEAEAASRAEAEARAEADARAREDAEAKAEAERKAEAEATAEAEAKAEVDAKNKVEAETEDIVIAAETANDESAVESEAVAEAKVGGDINPTEEEEETGAKDETEQEEHATGKSESAKDFEIVQPEEAEAQNEDQDDVFVNTTEAELGGEANESLIQENNIGHTEENTRDEEDAVADVTDSNAQCSSVRGSVDESSVLDHGAELEEANNSFVEEEVDAAAADDEQETIDK